MSTTTTV